VKGKSFSYDDLFPERWLHAEDLQGKAVTLKITDAYLEKLRLPGGRIDEAGILSFAKTPREYVLNKTNAMVLVGLWGKDSKDWVGHSITLEAVTYTTNDGTEDWRIQITGSPDIEAPVKVAQPQGKTRTIKVTHARTRSAQSSNTAPEPQQGTQEASDGAEPSQTLAEAAERARAFFEEGTDG
jgi:hypothetical protein